MSLMAIIKTNRPRKSFHSSSSWIIALVLSAFALPAGTADSPGDPKNTAFGVVDRNSDQIATVGNVLYSRFAYIGMEVQQVWYVAVRTNLRQRIGL